MIAWLPDRYAIIASLGIGLALSVATHLFVTRAKVYPEIACVGYTVFINGLVGIPPYEPEFEADAQGLLDDPASKRYLESVARYASKQIANNPELKNKPIVSVHLIPFQSPNGSFTGWPMRTRLPFSEVFIRTADTNAFDSTPFYFVYSTEGTRRIGYLALLLNGAVFAAFVLAYLTIKRYLTFAARKAKGLCVHCGYDTRQIESKACPECGNAP